MPDDPLSANSADLALSRPRDLKLGRNVKVLSGVSFFQDAASEMLYPVLPIFLTVTLGAPVAIVGMIEGIAEGTASVLRVVAGKLADRFPRRPLVGGGYGLSSVAKVIIGFAGGWPLVLAARVLDRIGKGIRGVPRDALIVADTPQEIRGKAFGLHRAADTAGAVIGPLIGLGLYELLDHRIRPLFFIAFIPAAISVSLILFVREAKPERPAKVKSGTPLTSGKVRYPAAYKRVVILLGLFGLANFTDALLILRAKSLGLGFASIVLVYAAYNVAYAALSYPAGVLSDRIPRRIVYAAGLVVFAIAYLGLGVVTTKAWVWVLLPVYGAYTALTDGVSRAWIADLLPKDRVGSGLGIFAGVQGATALLAGLWAGLAWHGNGRLPLIVSGVLAAIVALILLVAGRRIDPADPDRPS